MLTIDHALERLRERVLGAVVTPGDESWDDARRAWNLALDQRPELVVQAEGVQDVVAAVRFAREQGLRVALQGTGHGGHGLDLDGAILVKTERMRGVEIDPADRRARVQAGAQWQDVTVPAAEHGLAALAGSAADVGVVGYSLGGGIGWLARRHGLASNSILSADVVLADGRLVHVDESSEPELFWALRGGGGSFAAVVALEIALYPVAELYAGMLLYPWERAPEVLRAWTAMTAEAPDELTSCGRLLQLPPIDLVPEPLRGGQFVVVELAYLGDEAAAAPHLARLRELGPMMDTCAMVPAPALQALHMDPPDPMPGIGDGFMLDELPDDAIDALLEVAGPGSGSPILSLEIRHLGGELAVARPEHGAQPALDAGFVVFSLGIPMDADVAAALLGHFPRVRRALGPWDSGRHYFNLAEQETDPRTMYPAAAYDRLRDVKLAYDPADVFRANHRIPLPA